MNRLWENYFWAQGDRTLHFPPIEIMSAIPESKFDRIILRTSPQYQEVHNPKRTRRMRHYQRCSQARPKFSSWREPSPTPVNEMLSHVKAAPRQYHIDSQHQFTAPSSVYVSCPIESSMNSSNHSPEAPDRFYPLGEEAVYMLRDGQYTPLRDKKGRVLGDKYVQWTAPASLVDVETSTQEALHQACREIYARETTKMDRYMSWSSQIGTKWTIQKNV